MSLGLAELGNELCHEFDDRNHELGNLRLDILNLIKLHRNELHLQREADIADHRAARAHIRENVQALLTQYWEERNKLMHSLGEDRKTQTLAMQSQAKERKEDFEGWQKAILYIQKRRTGR